MSGEVRASVVIFGWRADVGSEAAHVWGGAAAESNLLDGVPPLRMVDDALLERRVHGHTISAGSRGPAPEADRADAGPGPSEVVGGVTGSTVSPGGRKVLR